MKREFAIAPTQLVLASITSGVELRQGSSLSISDRAVSGSSDSGITCTLMFGSAFSKPDHVLACLPSEPTAFETPPWIAHTMVWWA